MATAGPDWSVLAPRWDPAAQSAEGDAAAEAELASIGRTAARQLLIVAAASAVTYGLGALAGGAVA